MTKKTFHITITREQAKQFKRFKKIGLSDRDLADILISRGLANKEYLDSLYDTKSQERDKWLLQKAKEKAEYARRRRKKSKL